MSDPNVISLAPAKVNLALHVTGARDDGYTLLDTLVVFCSASDQLTLQPGPLSLSITGPEAEGLSTDDNLILDAVRLIGAQAQITLEKRLPVASGIGGGSADAAAALRGLAALTGAALPDRTERLGADVPMCLRSTPARAQGIGETLSDLPALPEFALLLVNPRVPVSTAQVFAGLRSQPGWDRGTGLSIPDRWHDTADFARWLRAHRNDLEPPARAIAPQIGTVLERLAATQNCLIARMSGSGATCFGLYPDSQSARAAARRMEPSWWAEPVNVLDTQPQLIRATT